MIPGRQSVAEILDCYPIGGIPFTTISSGSHGGYSGACLWRIRLDDGREFCLRQWPRRSAPRSPAGSAAAPSDQASHIGWIHRVLQSVVDQGFPEAILPLPLKTLAGATLLEKNGRLYELTRWMPGQADFNLHPTEARIHAVATTLAEFHRKCPPVSDSEVRGEQLAGFRQRQHLIHSLKTGMLSQIESRLSALPFRETAHTAIQCYKILEPGISRQLERLRYHNFRQQVCIRDIWHDHILFESDQISGLVDFGAMGIDNPATDLARLFGSLFQNCTPWWQLGTQAYQTIFELSAPELELIEVYDRSSTMLAGMNWLKWILVENRKFDSLVPIEKRISTMVTRMRDWV